MYSLTVILLSCLATALVVAILVYVLTTKHLKDKTTYMLDALEDNETNFRFNEDRLWGRGFNQALNRLHRLFDKERNNISEQERYYGQMLDHVRTGVIVLDQLHVNYCNQAARTLLGLHSFRNLNQLDDLYPNLGKTFASLSCNSEQRATFSTDRGERTITMAATEALIKGKTVKIVAFNDISSDIAENEELAWARLIRVLTHEIVNTITPISSLSDMLSQDIAAAQLSPDEPAYRQLDMQELASGLQTISTSAKGVIKFVNTYRNLTKVPVPVKTAFYLRDLVDRVLQLTAKQVAEVGAECSFVELTEDILLYADENQIAQILVNLVTNALQAEATKITITAMIDEADAVIIDVTNNGLAITPESQKQIFIPFFSTKPEGSGIGLSLSRQMMRQHNGTIHLARSNNQETVFTLIFR
ncbi:MAG: PAS domain-containing protein [Paludibacteraceae bacterium]|jgi:nitrogen fixation/metabolism regulation signal transduction histidine kinase|nr:PAS domain-containing protein [Paludibacteraceae bacterium]